jgi:hypothetical protein
MRLATPLADHLDGEEVAVILEAIAEIAETLAGLHAEDIAHRDLKPANLYWYEGGPALSDFGLVTTPDAESLTEPGRVPGAFGYISDEMIMHPDTADPIPADVFALAKVLWKLLNPSAEFPPQGPLRADGGPATLARSLTVARADALDRILEGATAPVDARLDMSTLASELRGWLTLSAPSELPDELQAALLAARRSMGGTLRERDAEASRERSVTSLGEHLVEHSRGLTEAIASLDPARAEVGPMAVGKLFGLIEQPAEMGRPLYGDPFHHGVRVTRGPEYDLEVLVLAFCLQADEEGNGAVDGLLLTGDERVSSAPWRHFGTRTAKVGVELEAAIDTIIEDATRELPAMLGIFAAQGEAPADGQRG